MTEIQAAVAGWVAGVAAWLPLGYAFGAGMVSSVNPCGFALLPAYLSLYLGAREPGFARRSASSRGLQALALGTSVTAGFVLLFGIVGAVVALGGRFLVGVMPWLAVVVGLALVALGIWLLGGGSLSFGLAGRVEAHLATGLRSGGTGLAKGTGARVLLLFGAAYGLASLSCTLPVFLVVVGSALAAGGFLHGFAQFLSYALGMGFVIVVLTLSAALFKGVLALSLRRLLPYVERASAFLLVLAGGYIVYYWLIQGQLLWSRA